MYTDTEHELISVTSLLSHHVTLYTVYTSDQ